MRSPIRPLRRPLTNVCSLSAATRERDETVSSPRFDAHAVSLVGDAPAMVSLRARLERAARSRCPVLLVGPTGSGKEVAARALHAWSDRRHAPMVEVNCGAIPESLAESELFGHEPGAFTGATRRREGNFTEAGEGTLFLDEVAELSLTLQVKLLRVLETGRFRPLGGGAEQVFRGRVVAATHADLAERVLRGAFREDLYYRLRVLPIEVPSLAERREDVPLLAEHFLREQERHLRLTERARAALCAYDWPGNVRQLRNVIDRLAVFSDGPLIDHDDVARELSVERPLRASRADECDLSALARRALDCADGDKLTAVERALIDEALRQSDGNKTEAARRLGVHRKVIERRLGRAP
ncbi:MAG: sigma-54 dependent transcriptional regulator [Polyangiales bacterium]